MTDKYTFDDEGLTGEMLEDFEEITGTSFFSFADPTSGEIDMSNFSGKAMSALMWLAMRMSGLPDATFDEARKEPLGKLALGEEAEVDPTDASSASE